MIAVRWLDSVHLAREFAATVQGNNHDATANGDKQPDIPTNTQLALTHWTVGEAFADAQPFASAETSDHVLQRS
jgi:hypothetical protein